MTIRLVPRDEWGARSPRYQLVYIASTLGVKVHYEGSPVPADLAKADHHSQCDDRMRAIQASHMANTKENYSDIAYNFVVCPHGYVFEGRGLHRLTGANGNQPLNHAHYSVCAMVGSSGLTEPTDAQLNGIRDAIEYLRAHGGAGNEIKGHRDGYATTCPGEPLYKWVKEGAPRPDGGKSTVPPQPPTHVPSKPTGARGSLGAWPGSPPVKYGLSNGSIQKLQLRLRSALGATKARQLNPNGATGYYGDETRALVREALKHHPETWDKGATHHDGNVGPKSWSVIDKL